MPADWKKIPALFPRDALHPAVVATADAHPAVEPWCVAFSGGADSLALLLLVLAHWPERRARLIALHFNHALRGAESDGDEAFCREVCARADVTFVSGRWIGAPANPGETAAREARHAFFKEQMAARGARVLWTGHQKDDIAETLLMRLARGSGPAGLAAPRPVHRLADGRVVLRPLLTLSKEQLTRALADAGIAWREDATNRTGNFLRNRVRLDVLPRWREAPVANALDGAALSRELCEEDDVALERWLNELGVRVADASIDLRPLAGKPRALLRRALRRWPPAASLSRAGLEELIVVCERGEWRRVSVGSGFVRVENGTVHWEPAAPQVEQAWGPLPLMLGGHAVLPDGATLALAAVTFDRATRQRVLAGEVVPRDEAVLAWTGNALVVRNWRAGDRYQPLGAPGSSKLQDLFVNRKVPAGERFALPVVCTADGDVLWVPGLPPAERWKVSDQSVTGVQLTYRRGTSTVSP